MGNKINKNNFHKFTKEELREVLANGDDTINNLLYINLYGYPRLATGKEKSKILKTGKYIVRDEIYGAYNGYVGKKFYDSTFDELFKDLKKAVDYCFNHDTVGCCLDMEFKEDL